jgi:MFS transporter, FSR family, fosmidomycin resistance protein
MDPNSQPPERGGSLTLFALLHAVNDQYTAFLAAIMPLLLERFGFGLAIAGLLAAVQSTATSFAQPVFGWFLDRARRQPNILMWPVITSVTLSLVAAAPSYRWMFPLLIVGGLSTAAFHPHATSSIPAVAGGRAGLAMAVFVSAGTVGYAVGPVFILWVVNAFGLGFSWLAALPTLALCLFMYRRGVARPISRPSLTVSHGLRLNGRLWALVGLWLIVVLRSTIGTAYMAFLGVHLRQIGFPMMQMGVALMTYTAAGAVGSMIGGHLADRRGGKIVIIGGLLLIPPIYYFLLRASGAPVWLWLVGAGFAISCFNPVTVVMAQSIIPESRGTAAGLIMGLGWSIGGLLVGVVGTVAERVGLVPVLTGLLWLVVPALVVAMSLPGKLGVPDAMPVREERVLGAG